MDQKYLGPSVEGKAVSASDVCCDLLAIPIFDGDSLHDLPDLDAASAGEVNRARASQEFRAKQDELFITRLGRSGWQAPRLALVGVGMTGGDIASSFRTAAATAVRAARQCRSATLAFLLRGEVTASEVAQAVAEGLLLGSFEDRRFKTDSEGVSTPVRQCFVVVPGPVTTELARSIEVGRAVGEGANRARELANAPGNLLTPNGFAEEAKRLVSESGVQVEVLDEVAIKELGMGLLLSVAKGSVEPPRLIVMRHEPADAPIEPVLGLVGKGITFDSGGISLKPADGMEQMKEDMAGGAAVVCAMKAIGTLNIPTRVIGVVPAAENMPGGGATRPGDVITSASGTTVEVINTDAEGRLVLGDALWYSQKLGATHIVDVATLTGACVVALGKVASGLFGQPRTWVNAVQRAADRAGEHVWPLPLFDEYKDQLKSEIADLTNSGGRPGGACTAATFLKTFVGSTSWAHVDIAGTAWADESRPAYQKGSTGVMVRTLTELARARETW